MAATGRGRVVAPAHQSVLLQPGRLLAQFEPLGIAIVDAERFVEMTERMVFGHPQLVFPIPRDPIGLVEES